MKAKVYWFAPVLLLAASYLWGTYGWAQRNDDVAQSVASKLPELRHSASHRRMQRRLKRIAQQDHEAVVKAMELISQPIADGVSVEQRYRIHRSSGLSLLVEGKNEEAVANYQNAYDLLPRLRGKITKKDFVDTTLELAVAYLRIAESENCVACCNGESCLFPIESAGVHKARRGSQQAIRYLEDLLGKIPNELRARWLLNLAYMTLGQYPEDVPPRFLISLKDNPTSDDYPFPKFRNIASAVSVNQFNLSGGAVCDDFDNDGDIDIVTSSWDSAGQVLYYRNNGDGSFTDCSKDSGLEGITGGLNLVHADFDNDNDLDVLVLRGAWLGAKEGRQPNSLLQNDGHGRFDDVAYSAGLADDDIDFPTQTAAWGDFDRDGWLDLYVGNEHFPSQLFRNQRDGTFVDVADSAGVAAVGFTKGLTWGDYDQDGDPDLYVSNIDSPNKLYRNNDDGTFTDVAKQLDVQTPIQSFPTWFWDFDNDGALDLWVGSAWWDLAYFVADYIDVPHNGETQRLYRGDGKGGFSDVSNETGLAEMNMPMGCNFGDLNNDGHLDFYLGTGFPDFNCLMPNVMYLNRDGQRFDDVTTQGGFGHLQKGHGISFADFDNDGDQDIFSQMGGAYPADGFYNSLYENPGFDHNFIRIRLVGTKSNRYAIGARIRIDITEEGQSRSIYRHVNAGSSFGANPLAQQIGLGKAKKIDRLVIDWPNRDSSSDAYRDLPVGRMLTITEGVMGFQQRALKTSKFTTEVSE